MTVTARPCGGCHGAAEFPSFSMGVSRGARSSPLFMTQFGETSPLHSSSATETISAYISGSRIFSALEVAGDVFSRADVGQQPVEPRRRALLCLLIGVRSIFQHLIEAAGCALEFLQFLSWDLLSCSFPDRLHQAHDPFAHNRDPDPRCPHYSWPPAQRKHGRYQRNLRRGGNQRLSSGTQCGRAASERLYQWCAIQTATSLLILAPAIL
jgi:hypothetical protein